MPVVWHQRKREEFDLISLKPFRKDSEEGIIVFGLMKDRTSSIATIEGMINVSGFVNTFLSRHTCDPMCKTHSLRVLQPENNPRPLLLSASPFAFSVKSATVLISGSRPCAAKAKTLDSRMVDRRMD